MHNAHDTYVQCSTFGCDVVPFRNWPSSLISYKEKLRGTRKVPLMNSEKSSRKIQLNEVQSISTTRLSMTKSCSASALQGNKGLFCVPFLKQNSIHISSKREDAGTTASTLFAYVSKKDIEEWITLTDGRQPITMQEHNQWLECICVNTVQCKNLPSLGEGEMVQIVDRDSGLLLSSFAKMEKNCFNLNSHSFADFTRASEQCFQVVTSNRSCAQFIGTSAFIGRRKSTSTRVRPTICSGPGEQLKSQYYRSIYEPTFIPLINKCLNSLASSASRVCKEIYGDYDKLLLKTRPDDRRFVDAHRYCSVTLFTSGKSGSSIGFANGLHKDNNDRLSQSWKQRCKDHVDDKEGQKRKKLKLDAAECNKYINSNNGPGLPTTCGYKVIIDESSNVKQSNVLAYFVNNDMNLCMKLEDDMVHCFLGYEFYHQTALPLVVTTNDLVYYSHKDIRVMAWGDN